MPRSSILHRPLQKDACGCQKCDRCAGAKRQKLSKEDERKLLSSVEKVAFHVDVDGLSPTEALAKVATEQRLTPDFIRLVGYAYNAGATTEQRLRHSDVLDKMAAVPLADIDEAIRQVYDPHRYLPKQSAEVSDDAYRVIWDLLPEYRPAADVAARKVAFSKFASAMRELGERAKLPPSVMTKKAQASLPVLDRKQDELWEAVCRAGTLLKEAMRDSRIDKDTFIRSCEVYYGKNGRLAADVVWSASQIPERWGRRVKCAYASVGLDHPLMREIGNIIKLAGDVAHKVRRPVSGKEKAAQGSKRPSSRVLKAGSTMAGFFTGMLAQSVKSRNPDSKVEDAIPSLEPPRTQMEKRKIRSEAMLANFMANDEVISQYDPEEVVAAYNEISQLMPRASTQPVMLRALLRKRLAQGAAEPFETAQSIQVERNLWNRRQ